MQIETRKFARYAVYTILLIESLSFLAHLNPGFKPYAFCLVSLAFSFIAWRSLGLGLVIAFSELLIGSKGGYLFAIDVAGNDFSIRMSFWLMLLLLWAYQNGKALLFQHSNPFAIAKNAKWLIPFLILILSIVLSLAIALITDNPFTLIFADANAYLYFLLILPVLHFMSMQTQADRSHLLDRFLLALSIIVTWIAIKSLFILFMFSHRLDFLNGLLYSWIRQSGVGEITQMSGGFYRVFFQSHIFLIVYLLAALFWTIKNYLASGIVFLQKKKTMIVSFSLVLVAATSTISMSRSNWVGLIVSFFCLALYIIWRFRARGMIAMTASVFALSLASYILIIALIKFPFPRPIGGFDANDILQDRASEFKDEAGASSRWQLLPELGKKISEAPILGSGFGETVTYTSNDPRVRTQNPDGRYTTYAFEWGWLETWIKLGLIGLGAYIWLIAVIIISFLRISRLRDSYEFLSIGMAIGLLAIAATNFFSPYLNHPLGIGFILMAILAQSLLPKAHNTPQ